MAGREFHAATSAAEVSTTSNTSWTPVVELSFTAPSGQDYALFWSFEGLNVTSTNSDMRFRVARDGVPVATGRSETRITSEYPAYSGFLKLTGDGGATTVAIEIQNENNSATVVARNGNLVALALSADDRYAESLGRTGALDSAFVPLVGLSWTPAAGEYLLFGSTFVDTFATTAPAYARLQFDGVSAPEQSAGPADVTAGNPDLVPLGAMWVRRVSAGGVARTATFQGRSHSSAGETGFRDTRLMALRLDTFAGAHHAELAALNGGAESSFVEVLSLSAPSSSGPYLVLANWSISASSSGAISSVQIAEDGAAIGLGVRRSTSASADRGVFGGLFTLRPASPAGERNWTLSRRSNDGAFIVNVMPGANLTVVELGPQTQSFAIETGLINAMADPARLVMGRRLPIQSRALSANSASAAAFHLHRRLAAAAGAVVLAAPATLFRKGRRLEPIAFAVKAKMRDAAISHARALIAEAAFLGVGAQGSRLAYSGFNIWTPHAVGFEAWSHAAVRTADWRPHAIQEEVWI
jgi:hypothetical protein